GVERERHDQCREVRGLRPAPARPRSLLAPAGRLHGRHGRCRGSRRISADPGGVWVSHDATIPVEVRAVEQVTPLIKQFTFGPVEGGELPPFSGGSHVIVVLRRKDRTFRSPYSLVGSPRDRNSYRIAVRRHADGRGGSLYLHEQVRVGTRLDV